ncbi:MAG: DUF423 domain-containing protein [Ferruginibacter sp.]|nr:DUF423 domain-containing protein [Cytophagales bacterium]
MHKVFLLAGTALGGVSVMIGAFGAHALRNALTVSGRMETFETAVRYQFYHALALVMLGLFLFRADAPALRPNLFSYAGYCFLAGIFVFSGSLYVLCLTNVRQWGAVTPFGGVFLIAGWVLWFWGVWQSER